MQFIYKLFVSEKEVVHKLPLIVPRLTEKQMDNFIKSIRKFLFFKKIKKLFKLNKMGL